MNDMIGCLNLLEFAEALVLSPIEWFLLAVIPVARGWTRGYDRS